MSEYSADINADLYKYQQRVFVTEVTGQNRTRVPLKLNLNSGNFNFDFARSDGADFRLAERSNGTGVFQMWTAYWNNNVEKATLWFKLPELLASETRTLYAYWGFEHDSGISDLDSLTNGEDITYSDNVSTNANGTAFKYSNSGYFPSDIYPATNAFDEDTNTYIWFNAVSGPAYVGIDFGGGNEKQIEMVRLHQHDIKQFIVQGSNDNIVYDDLYTFSLPDMAGGLVPDILDWTGYHAFTNDTAYRYMRIYINTSWDDFFVGEVEMFEVTSRTRNDSGIFLFSDDFDGDTLDTGKWSSSNGSWTISNSQINLGTDAWIRCDDAAPLDGIISWVVEDGIEGIGSPSSTTVAAHRYRFYGGENRLAIDYYWEGSIDRRHDAVTADSLVTYNGVERGLEIGSYSQNYFGYFEDTDNVYQGMYNRDTYSDYDDSWERKVHRNTELNDFRIYGEDTSAANGVAIDWVVAREYTPDSDPEVDYSDLYVEYENVPHQPLEDVEYASDLTAVDFYHSSDMGGDPYRMSDDITNSISNIFISDEGTTEGSIVIDFGRSRYSATDSDYTHYNSDDTVEFYNASKLSDLDSDVHGRDYWATTTTSGWAAIQYPDSKDIACLSLKAVPGNTAGMPDNFRFYGSQSNPRFSGWYDKVLIYEGQARAEEEEQTFYFSTGLTLYEYYILEVLDTHGNNVAIQEWGMYERLPGLGNKVISQVRLHPVTFTDNEYYFPKEIEVYGSNDGFVWDKLLNRTETPTPFEDYAYGRWSRYSFENFDTYYLYKLTCYDNWNADTYQIKMAEWEMVERIEEADNLRILGGSTNDINNIWADPNTAISSGVVYITNDEFNSAVDEKLLDNSELPLDADDFNVRL